jgi:putative ABC transport system permease protein
MRPYALLYFYRRRLRVHLVQELLAGTGIAIAVALVLSTLVAEGSIASSTERVVRAIVGPATVQLRTRAQTGFPETLLARIEHLPGVKQAGPILEVPATLSSHSGRRTTIELAGANVSLATLDGLARTLPISALAPGGVGVTRASAERLGITARTPDPHVTANVRGRRFSLKVGAILGPESAGALSEALVAVMSLPELQRISGLSGRISRVLVEPTPGATARVRKELERLSAGRMEVGDANLDVNVLAHALRPSEQAATFFSTVAGMLGLLFAFTAMLLTVPERRRAIADMRLVGTRRRSVVQMVIFQALCLGILASAVGVLAGYALSRWALHMTTGYLAEAFTIGTGTVVHAKPLLLAFAGGVLATCLASVVPLADLRRGRRMDAVYAEDELPGASLPRRTRLAMALGALCALAAVAAVSAYWPTLALSGAALIAIAVVLAVPLVLTVVLAAARWLADRLPGMTALHVALASMKSTSLRSLALAATGGVAIFGSVALGGARSDLLSGIQSFSASYTADAPVWVINPDDNQAVTQLAPSSTSTQLRRAPGVAWVRRFHGTFLDIGQRRVWVIARDPTASSQLLSSQLVHGTVAAAQAGLARGGELVLSQQLMESLHGHIGGLLTLPTPSGPARFQIAATTTNLAWSPGAVFLSSADFTRLWGSTEPTAYGVGTMPGADPRAVAAEVRRALGPASGMEVSTAATRRHRIDQLTSEGLGRLGEIAALLSLAAVLAMGASLASSIWQRRISLSGLRLAGVRPRRLRRILFVESLLMLGAGCLTGALLGVLGEYVIDGYLRHVTGFPVASPSFSGRPLGVTAIVLAGALLLVATPAWLASHASPSLALGAQE